MTADSLGLWTMRALILNPIMAEPSLRAVSVGWGRGGGVDSQMGGSWGESTRDLREIRGGNEDMEIRLVLTLNPAE